jgi:hypothetical protein
MNLALLRVEGEEDMLELIVEHLDLKPEQRWKAGEESRQGVPYRSSGFSTTVADAPTPAQMLARIREFVSTCRQRSTDFLDVQAELSIGVAVGGATQYVVTLDFNHVILRQLADLGITLSVAAYPSGVPEHG